MELEQKRLALHEFLCGVLGDRNCYYSSPASLQMNYPCIKYDLSDPRMLHADNIPYLVNLQWTITVIDEDPDSEIASRFFSLPKCRFDRKFSSDDLNHFVFSLYF